MQTLSLIQKKKIVEESRYQRELGETATQPAIAEWAKQALELKNHRNQSTISQFIKSTNK